VDEELAWKQADYLVGRHAAVGAADPEMLRRLLLREDLEERGIAPGYAARPLAIVLE
jgi:hypothetical protein